MNKAVYVFSLTAFFGMLLACKNSNFEKLKEEYEAKSSVISDGAHIIDTSKTISFKKDILFIMQTHCGTGTCHSAQTSSGGIALYDYVGVKAAQETDGLLYSSVSWDGNAIKMPNRSRTQIDALYIAAIKKWIDNGMPNN